jgi:hypothetical protein
MKSGQIENKYLVELLSKDGPFPLEFSNHGDQPVHSVSHAHVIKIALNGPVFALITAAGTVTTTGWSHPRLQPYIYVQPPSDGIWDFVFIADPPSGIAADVITPISASYIFKTGVFDLKGVRIHSATNTVEAMVRDRQIA